MILWNNKISTWSVKKTFISISIDDKRFTLRWWMGVTLWCNDNKFFVIRYDICEILSWRRRLNESYDEPRTILKSRSYLIIVITWKGDGKIIL